MWMKIVGKMTFGCSDCQTGYFNFEFEIYTLTKVKSKVQVQVKIDSEIN